MEERLREAIDIFEDLSILFSNPESCKYLLSVATEEIIFKVFDELEHCFTATEDYEKCLSIQKWRREIQGEK